MKLTRSMVFFSALFVRLIMVILLGNEPTLWEYDTAAKNILNGNGFVIQHLGSSHYAWGAPFYPFFCMVLYKLTNFNYSIVLVVQCLVSSGFCVLIYLISQRIFGKRTAIIATLLIMFHPGLLFYVAKHLHALTFDSFFFGLLILVLLNLKDRLTFKNQLIVGIVFGVAILSKPTIVLFLPLSIVWIMWRSKRKLSSALLITITAVLVISPWIIRNYLHYNRFVFIRSDTWEVLWRGNNPQATGTLYYAKDKSFDLSVPENICGKDENIQRAWFKEEVLKFWKTHPFQAIKLYFKKIYYFWWFSEFSGQHYRSSWLNAYKIYYFFVLVTFLGGIFKALRNFKYPSLVLMLICSICLMQSLFYVEGRHRWSVEGLMLIFSAFCILRGKNRDNANEKGIL